MNTVTKGFHCQCCDHKQNVEVAETVLGLVCPGCRKWVWLGKAIGLDFWGAAILAVLAVVVFKGR